MRNKRIKINQYLLEYSNQYKYSATMAKTCYQAESKYLLA